MIFFINEGKRPVVQRQECFDAGRQVGNVVFQHFDTVDQYDNTLLIGQLFELSHICNGGFVGGIATQSPNGIGGVAHAAAVIDDGCNFGYVVS